MIAPTLPLAETGRAFEEQEQEQLLQLLYLSPVAIAKLNTRGDIELMNPYGAQLLMPISPNGKLENIFDIFELTAPELCEMSRRFTARVGRICEEHRIIIPNAEGEGVRSILSITLDKVDDDIMVAAIADVTAAGLREQYIRASEERLHAVLDGVKDYAICTVDPEGIVTSWNRSAERLDGYRADEVIGKAVDFLSPTRATANSTQKRLKLARRDGWHEYDEWRIRKDGSRYWANSVISVLRDKDDESILGFSIITRDITARKRSEDELVRFASTDSLTGVFNRRSFLQAAREHSSRDAAANRPFAMLLIDADRFKVVNDTYGHDAGDLALVHIVTACREETRTADVVGRYGGEEFVVALSGSDAESARQVAERIRLRIAAQLVETPAGSVGVTASIGVAATNLGYAGVDALLHAADLALYEAKEAGRNRVAIAAPPSLKPA